MSSITRKQVLPGDVITRGDYRAGSFVEKRGEEFIAQRIGLAEIVRNDVKVIPLSGPYIPRVEDLVVGKVINSSGFGWEVDINSCFKGYLPAVFVFGRDFSPATHDLSSRFVVGDMMLCMIGAFDRARDPQISIRGPGLGKIPQGDLVRISPTKVPRLLGRNGSMIKMISGHTGCEINAGQNGLIVLVGSPDAMHRAAEAIKMIEEEAQTAGLSEKVESFLVGHPTAPAQASAAEPAPAQAAEQTGQ